MQSPKQVQQLRLAGIPPAGRFHLGILTMVSFAARILRKAGAQGVAALIMLLVFLCPAHAQIVAKPTVQRLLASCDSLDQETKKHNCRQLIGSFMLWGVEAQTNASYKAPGTPKLCMPITAEALKGDRYALKKKLEVYVDAVIGWLKAHPDERSKDEGTGIDDATTALYECGQF